MYNSFYKAEIDKTVQYIDSVMCNIYPLGYCSNNKVGWSTTFKGMELTRVIHFGQQRAVLCECL